VQVTWNNIQSLLYFPRIDISKKKRKEKKEIIKNSNRNEYEVEFNLSPNGCRHLLIVIKAYLNKNFKAQQLLCFKYYDFQYYSW